MEVQLTSFIAVSYAIWVSVYRASCLLFVVWNECLSPWWVQVHDIVHKGPATFGPKFRLVPYFSFISAFLPSVSKST